MDHYVLMNELNLHSPHHSKIHGIHMNICRCYDHIQSLSGNRKCALQRGSFFIVQSILMKEYGKDFKEKGHGTSEKEQLIESAAVFG